jgi:hypothetical protein
MQVCDGTQAWLQFPDKLVDATRFISEYKRGILMFGGGWGLYERVLEGKLSGQFIGEEEIDGKKTDGVALQSPFSAVTLYFDPATHLVAAARYKSDGPNGPVENEQRWSDYRTVEGRQFAFSTVIYREGAKFLESNTQDLSVNPAIDESLFVKPQPPATK